MTCIAIIPARGGSRRIPRKNIRDFEGKPIIAYSILVAQQSGLFDGVWVSTEDDEITDCALGFNAGSLTRSLALAQDDVGTQRVVHDACWRLGLQSNDLVCCIYATAPLMRLEDLRLAKKVLLDGKNSYAMAVNEEPLFDAGQFYFGKAGAFRAHVPLIGTRTRMIPVPPEHVQDINTEEDWQAALVKYRALKAQGKL